MNNTRGDSLDSAVGSRERINSNGSTGNNSDIEAFHHHGYSNNNKNGNTNSSVSSSNNSNHRLHDSASSQRGTRRRKIVDWIQKQPVPRILARRRQQQKPVKESTSATAAAASAVNTGDTVYVLSGLDRVIFGTVAAADAVLIAGVQPPRYLWYMLSGAICDVIQFSMDLFLHRVLEVQDASICWALSFFLSIFFRHTSHRYFVFGDYVGGYWNSLARMYAGYSVIIVLSTLFNILMTRVATLSHYLAWILTLLWTGIANYFILKRIWTFGGSGSSNVKADASSASSS